MSKGFQSGNACERVTKLCQHVGMNHDNAKTVQQMATLAEHDHESLCQVELSHVVLGDINIGIINTYCFNSTLLCCKAISIRSSLNRAILGLLHKNFDNGSTCELFLSVLQKRKDSAEQNHKIRTNHNGDHAC